MRRTFPFAVLLASTAGCAFPWEPATGPLYGRVTYPGGAPAQCALVAVVHGDTTFSGYDGRFWLPVPKGLDTLTVFARDGLQPGVAYAETHGGSVRVPVRKGAISVRIVLTESTPI